MDKSSILLKLLELSEKYLTEGEYVEIANVLKQAHRMVSDDYNRDIRNIGDIIYNIREIRDIRDIYGIRDIYDIRGDNNTIDNRDDDWVYLFEECIGIFEGELIGELDTEYEVDIRSVVSFTSYRMLSIYDIVEIEFCPRIGSFRTVKGDELEDFISMKLETYGDGDVTVSNVVGGNVLVKGGPLRNKTIQNLINEQIEVIHINRC